MKFFSQIVSKLHSILFTVPYAQICDDVIAFCPVLRTACKPSILNDCQTMISINFITQYCY